MDIGAAVQIIFPGVAFIGVVFICFTWICMKSCIILVVIVAGRQVRGVILNSAAQLQKYTRFILF